ncbi:MAG: hypothetical protein M0Z42_15715 [Actinomycetota bacterium]|nr:hypothetical protein [Actinomycetota bacterium]
MLITVVIIGLTAVPLVGMLLETIGGASEHRELALIDTLLKSFSETATSQLESSPRVGFGTLNGTTATSSTLFTGTANYAGYGISGTGIKATTVITSETNTEHTATLSLAAASRTTAEPLTIGYQACATTYHLMSDPSTLSGPNGTPVTVFVTGFQATSPIPLTAFRVDIGTVTTLTPTPSPKSSGPDAHGNARITFKVPPAQTLPPTHSYSITVKADGKQVTSFPGRGFTVTSTGNPLVTSPDAGYIVGITTVEYWTPRSDTFGPTCTRTTASGGVQQLTVSATGPGHVSDHLTATIRNPVYTAVPQQTPSVLVTGQSIALPTSGAGPATLIFTATVTPAATAPTPPSQPVTWTITEPSGARTGCTSKSQTTGAGNSETYTCTLEVTSSGTVGLYTATATYPGDAYDTAASGSGEAGVYAPNGSGTMTVAPPSVTPSSPSTLTFTYTAANGGTKLGEVTITVPVGWTTPQATPARKTTPGYCSATGGTGADAVAIGATGRLVEVTDVSLTATHNTLQIVFAKATVATGTASPSHFTSAEASVSTVTPVPLQPATTHASVTS